MKNPDLLRSHLGAECFCSKECVDRFRARQRGGDRVGWLQIAFDQSPGTRDAPAGERKHIAGCSSL